MPVFTIETPTGQKLDIEAADQSAALAGAQQWHTQNQPSVVSSFEHGAAGVPGGIAKTLQTHLGEGPVGNALQSAAQSAEPDHYTPANIYDDKGFHAGNIPAWMAERAPGMAAAIAAARVTPGPWWAKMLGGAAAGTMMSAGNEAQTAADNRTGTPNSPVTGEDLKRGDLTALGENAVGSLPITRFLPGSGAVTSTGVKGVANAVKKYATTAALQGAAGAGGDVAHQVGQSVGTPGGVSVDPAEVADAAAGNTLTGGLFGAKNAARDTLNAVKYREVTPELRDAATQFANRMQEHADGRNLDAGLFMAGKAQKVGAEVTQKATAAVQGELSDAVKDLRSRVDLPQDASNVLDAAKSGHQPTDREYGILENAVKGDPQASNVMNLVRQAHVADIVRESGHLGDGKFSGGITGHVGQALTGHNLAKTALVAGGAAALEEGAGHLIAYSPEILAALAGGKALASVADKLTGARAPAGRFVRAFADGNTPIRQTVTPPQPPPAPPGAGVGPTGPSVPPAPTPWGPTPPAPPTLSQGQRQQMVMQANLPLRALAKLAKQPVVKHGLPVLAGVVGGGLAGEVGAHLASSGTHEAIHSFNEKMAADEAMRQGAQMSLPPFVGNVPSTFNGRGGPETAQVPSAILPKDLAAQTKKLALSLQKMQQLKLKGEGQNQADEVASGSPLIDRVGGPAAVTNPEAGKRMAQMVSAANAIKKLEAIPGNLPGRVTGAAQTVTGVPRTVTAVSKANGKVEHTTTNGQDEYAIPSSPYAHLPISEAANNIAKDAERGGKVKYLAGFRSATIRNLTAIRTAATGVATEVPGLDSKVIASQFEGVSSRKDAVAHREWLKQHFPQAAGALDTYFNDGVIDRIWKRK